MTLGVQSHLFFIISDLVRRPLHAACALALPSPAWQPPRAPAAPRPTPALAPRLRVDAAARVGGGGGVGVLTAACVPTPLPALAKVGSSIADQVLSLLGRTIA